MAGEKENKNTIYQGLNKMLNLDGFGYQDSSSVAPVATPEKSKIVIKGSSPEEIHRKGLEIEQKRELQNKFFRTTDRGFQKALQYEAARLPAYIDYEGMEYYPIISSALDLFMEEATTIGLNGKMLNIFSNKERIKVLLEEFFYDVVNVNVNLPFWVRNLCKYGDNFVLLYGERKKGITHVKQLVNYEIERFERIQNGKPLVKFKERMTGDEFNVFEIAHFRLLGDDKYLPYGSSILNKVRRVFRQLVMAEDAMLTYRIIRAGEKKVFKIDVGNIDEDDIEEYIYKVATTFKKTPQVQPNDGQIDYRFNILGNDEDYFLPVRNANTQTGIETLPGACLALDTKIELLDGRSLKLNDIINEYESGKELWSYSINPKTGEIVPGKITWAGVTRKNTDVLKIILDNNETIISTPDHKFPTKFNGIKQAQDLVVGESMWAFNKKEKIIKGGSGTRNTYEMIYDHSINDWIYTHRMVANYMKEKNLHEIFNHKINENNLQTIHHKDYNRYNNNPQNLCWMNSKDHFYYHHDTAKEMYDNYSDETKLLHKKQRKFGINEYWINISDKDLIQKRKTAINNSLKSRNKANETFNNNPNKDEIIRLRGITIGKTKSLEKNRKKQSNLAKEQWKNTNLHEIIKEKQTIKYSEKLIDLLIDYYDEYGRIDLILENKININSSEWLNEFNRLNPNNKQLNKMTEITRNNIDKLLKHFGYSNWRDFKNKVPCYNHKIVDIEWLTDKQDTGTITIDGQEQLHDYHTFALSCGIFTRNSNLDQIHDIEYLRDNLFTGLGIPKPFLSFQDSAGGGKNMAQYDIRFAKKINRIQQAIIQELNKMAMVHLFLLGYSSEDLNGFMLTLTNPSTQQELLKSELLRDKAQTYTELTRAEGGVAAMSHTGAKRMIFNMSDREIVDDLKQQKMEKVVMQELADAPVSIKKSGLFVDIDDRFGEPIENMPISGETESEMPPEGGVPPLGGDMNAPDMGAAGDMGAPLGSAPLGGGAAPMMETRMTEEEYINHIEKLVYGSTQETNTKKNVRQKEIIQENNTKNKILNKKAMNMVIEIENLLESTESINTQQKNVDNQDIEIENIDEMELDD